MKKLVKICAVTGLVLLVLGIGITTVSAAMGGGYRNSFPTRLWSRIWHNHISWGNDWDSWDDWDDRDDPDNYADSGDDSSWQHWNEEELHGDSHRSPAAPQGNAPAAPDNGSGAAPVSDPSFTQARKLDVDIDKGVVHISRQDGISQIQINVQDDYNQTQCYMDEYTLEIKREARGHRSNDAPYIQVLVPAGYELEKLSLDMGAAECNVQGITAGKLEIDTGVGAITFSGTVNGSVEVETGVGDVTLNMTGPQTGYNYKVECGVGSINVGNEHYTTLSHETHINNNAPYNMELECGVGNISVNFDTSL